MGFQPGIQSCKRLAVIMADRKWRVFKSAYHGRWYAGVPNEWHQQFDTHPEAFDHAFTEATRELSDR